MRVTDVVEKMLRRFSIELHVVLQLIRYGVTGASAVVADYLSFALLYGVLKTPLIVATVTSLLVGFVVSFVLNKIWVFGAHKQQAYHGVARQTVLYLFLLAFNTGFTYVFILYTGHWFSLNAYIAKLCCIAIIMVWNYVIYKKVIFRLR